MEKGFDICEICGDDPRSDEQGKPLCVETPQPLDCPRAVEVLLEKPKPIVSKGKIKDTEGN